MNIWIQFGILILLIIIAWIIWSIDKTLIQVGIIIAGNLEKIREILKEK